MPEKCESCDEMTVRDRREDYGDVCMPYYQKVGKWLDFFEDELCRYDR